MLPFNIRRTAIAASSDHQMSASAHRNQGTKTMTKIAIITAIVLNAGLVTGFATTLSPTVPGQNIAADLGGEQDIARMSASRKVRCIMPPAQQTYCNR